MLQWHRYVEKRNTEIKKSLQIQFNGNKYSQLVIHLRLQNSISFSSIKEFDNSRLRFNWISSHDRLKVIVLVLYSFLLLALTTID